MVPTFPHLNVGHVKGNQVSECHDFLLRKEVHSSFPVRHKTLSKEWGDTGSSDCREELFKDIKLRISK